MSLTFSLIDRRYETSRTLIPRRNQLITAETENCRPEEKRGRGRGGAAKENLPSSESPRRPASPPDHGARSCLWKARTLTKLESSLCVLCIIKKGKKKKRYTCAKCCAYYV